MIDSDSRNAPTGVATQCEPIVRSLEGGQFAACVSLRRGQGRQCLDKIYRFRAVFASNRHALNYARWQCRHWHRHGAFDERTTAIPNALLEQPHHGT